MMFSDFDLHDEILRGIEKAGFTQCMDVQTKTLGHTLERRDVYVQSQTGSGKTAAFLISVFELFMRGAFPRNRAVVIVPTRELAVQIEREAKLLGSFLPYRVGSFYGGVGYNEQIKMLQENVEIVVGTPGRLIDLASNRKLDFRDTSILVIDEADRLFDMGFLPDLRRMLRKMPPRSKRMTMLFSATLSARVWQLAWEHMNSPVEITMNPEKLTVDEISHELYHVSRNEKLSLLLGLLERDQPANALIFSNTKNGAVELAQRLTHNGYACEFIIGDLPQKRRIRIIDRLKSGELRYLVATDVAARGLHVDDLDLVVNYDIPEDPENYVHRIGRTARAGKSGKAISLACERYVYGLEAIEELIDMKIPVMWPDESLFKEDSSAGIHFGRERYGRPSGKRTGQREDYRRNEVQRKRPGGQSRPRHGQRIAQEHEPRRRDDASQKSPAKSSPRKPDGQPRKESRAPAQPGSIEERLAHYRQKYGEDFRLVESGSGKSAPKQPAKKMSADSNSVTRNRGKGKGSRTERGLKEKSQPRSAGKETPSQSRTPGSTTQEKHEKARSEPTEGKRTSFFGRWLKRRKE